MIDLQVLANYIANPSLRSLTKSLLDDLDPKFWEAPASSSGKYHPEFDFGCGGLTRHTALVTLMAADGLRRYYTKEPFREIVDAVLCAGLLHDGWKNGDPWGPHTVKTHPEIGACAIEAHAHLLADDEQAMRMLSWVVYAVRWHYGIWTSPAGRTPLQIVDIGTSEQPPASREAVVAALVLQEADYYASRTYLGAPLRHQMERWLDQYEVKGVNDVELP